jgi:hypothetical protein
VFQQRASFRRRPVLAYFRSLEAAYPAAQTIFLVVDNWPVHFHPEVLDGLATSRIVLLGLPSYAPWTNPVEKLWRQDNYDADYAGADLMFPSGAGKELLVLYQGVTKTFGDTISDNAFYSVVALAASEDSGLIWTRRGVVITGTDPKPTSNPRPGANGADQSGAIVANGYVYDFYPYFPSRSNAGPTIQPARVPLDGGAAPGTWIQHGGVIRN